MCRSLIVPVCAFCQFIVDVGKAYVSLLSLLSLLLVLNKLHLENNSLQLPVALTFCSHIYNNNNNLYFS